MNTKKVQDAIEKLKKNSIKRKFVQTVDFIVTLKDIDLKNPEQQIDFYMNLNRSDSKKNKVCAIIGDELKTKVKDYDYVITEKEFVKYQKDKKAIKKLAENYDFFIAQANLMPQVAKIFGRQLGPRGKMPNPKAGCIVNIKTDLLSLYSKLQNMERVQAKSQMQIQVSVGSEDMDSKEISSNILNVYEQLIHHLIKGEDNIKRIMVKLTMSSPIEVPSK